MKIRKLRKFLATICISLIITNTNTITALAAEDENPIEDETIEYGTEVNNENNNNNEENNEDELNSDNEDNTSNNENNNNENNPDSENNNNPDYYPDNPDSENNNPVIPDENTNNNLDIPDNDNSISENEIPNNENNDIPNNEEDEFNSDNNDIPNEEITISENSISSNEIIEEPEEDIIIEEDNQQFEYQELTQEVYGKQIKVKGDLPANIKLQVDLLNPDDYEVDGNKAIVEAYDIKLKLNGELYEPEDDGLTVTVEINNLPNSANEIIHIENNGDTETFNITGDKAEFETDSFSVYLVSHTHTEECYNFPSHLDGNGILTYDCGYDNNAGFSVDLDLNYLTQGYIIVDVTQINNGLIPSNISYDITGLDDTLLVNGFPKNQTLNLNLYGNDENNNPIYRAWINILPYYQDATIGLQEFTITVTCSDYPIVSESYHQDDTRFHCIYLRIQAPDYDNVNYNLSYIGCSDGNDSYGWCNLSLTGDETIDEMRDLVIAEIRDGCPNTDNGLGAFYQPEYYNLDLLQLDKSVENENSIDYYFTLPLSKTINFYEMNDSCFNNGWYEAGKSTLIASVEAPYGNYTLPQLNNSILHNKVSKYIGYEFDYYEIIDTVLEPERWDGYRRTASIGDTVSIEHDSNIYIRLKNNWDNPATTTDHFTYSVDTGYNPDVNQRYIDIDYEFTDGFKLSSQFAEVFDFELTEADTDAWYANIVNHMSICPNGYAIPLKVTPNLFDDYKTITVPEHRPIVYVIDKWVTKPDGHKQIETDEIVTSIIEPDGLDYRNLITSELQAYIDENVTDDYELVWQPCTPDLDFWISDEGVAIYYEIRRKQKNLPSNNNNNGNPNKSDSDNNKDVDEPLDLDNIILEQVESTCLDNGYIVKLTNGISTKEEIEALGHDTYEIIENKINPTFESDGSYDIVTYCDRCGVELDRVHKIIPKLTRINDNPDDDNDKRKTPTVADDGNVVVDDTPNKPIDDNSDDRNSNDDIDKDTNDDGNKELNSSSDDNNDNNNSNNDNNNNTNKNKTNNFSQFLKDNADKAVTASFVVAGVGVGVGVAANMNLLPLLLLFFTKKKRKLIKGYFKLPGFIQVDEDGRPIKIKYLDDDELLDKDLSKKAFIKKLINTDIYTSIPKNAELLINGVEIPLSNNLADSDITNVLESIEDKEILINLRYKKNDVEIRLRE